MSVLSICIASLVLVVVAAQPDGCSTAQGCTECTGLGQCGWCSYTNTCEEGNATESFSGCAAPYWSWTNSQCGTPAPPASVCGSSDCESCTTQSGCGYCFSTALCEPGNSSMSDSGCSAFDWAWSTSQCDSSTSSAFPSACGDASNDCLSCTTMGGCGYCVSSTYCEPITASGSSSGECSQWLWNSSQC